MATKKKAVKAKAAEKPMKKYKEDPLPGGLQAIIDKALSANPPTAAVKKKMEDSSWSSDKAQVVTLNGKCILQYNFRYKGYKLSWVIQRKAKATAKRHGLEIIGLCQRNGDAIPEVNHKEVEPLLSGQMQEQFLFDAARILRMSDTEI